jgi:predicted RNA binding protein YcfA (HicA-like mRNA interferase family)
MPRTFSGKEIISILQRKFGFSQISTSGSHVKLRKYGGSVTITTIVPLHKEVFIGTFKSILRQANISQVEFIEKSVE